jgi:hypothetical protein
MKNQLRDQKLLSFIRFKFIAEIVYSKIHLYNKNILLGLVVIAGQINPKDKLGNKIRYLNPEQQYYVINNIIPEGLDISKLTESITNLKSKPLTLDFVYGLFESNTNNYKKVSKQDQDFIRDNFLPDNVQLYQFKDYYLTLNKTYSGRRSLDVIKKPIRRLYSTATIFSQREPKLNPWFVSGFLDGVASFSVVIVKKSNSRLG